MHTTFPTQPPVPSSRGVFCNRTLNLRSVKAIGYDMDYTLVGYDAEAFEQRVYAYAKARLLEAGWPVEGLAFDASMVARGLIMDLELGNVVKANRFGFIKQAMHGTHALDHLVQREAYAGILVDLADPRWVFLNTLFSLSEGCLYAQLVDLLDAGRLPGVLGYGDLYRKVRQAVDAQHAEGRLKAEVLAEPERCVVLEAESALALLDQKQAGKKLLLITNSEWEYTRQLMTYAYDRFLPEGMRWRDLFDLVIVGARKPDFFTGHAPFFEVVSEDGLLRPVTGRLEQGRAYLGGCASQVERDLGIAGDEFLYVGDHMFGDVHVSKSTLRWRTILILRELEDEMEALEAFAGTEAQLAHQMAEKEALEAELSSVRLRLQRIRGGYGPLSGAAASDLEGRLQSLRQRLLQLDADIAPMARTAAALMNPRWGLLSRAGNDKSHLARQVERYADLYTSRVSNLLHATPFAYFRSRRGSLPHDARSLTLPTTLDL